MEQDLLYQALKASFQLPDTQVADLIPLFKMKHLAKGESHTQLGQYRTELSFIVKGSFNMFALKDGKQITQWLATEKEWVCDLNTLIFDQPARWNIEASEDSILYSLSRHDYNQLPQIMPQWNLIEKQFLSHCFVMLENRVFSLLSLNAEERYVKMQEQRPEVFKRFPQHQIASMLGMTPETFSRIRKKLIS